jgi:hypothetical protein
LGHSSRAYKLLYREPSTDLDLNPVRFQLCLRILGKYWPNHTHFQNILLPLTVPFCCRLSFSWMCECDHKNPFPNNRSPNFSVRYVYVRTIHMFPMSNLRRLFTIICSMQFCIAWLQKVNWNEPALVYIYAMLCLRGCCCFFFLINPGFLLLGHS